VSDNVIDTEKRFEILVPNPKTRINLGKRNLTDTGPFGYDGLSISTVADAFIGVDRSALLQSELGLVVQASGSLRHFSTDPLFISSQSDVTVGGKSRVILASGAGQGAIGSLSEGTTLRLPAYNELSLHYLVDGLQSNLFEFFNGRRKQEITEFGILKKVKVRTFYSADGGRLSGAKASPLLNKDKAAHSGGFLHAAARSWEVLENGVRESKLAAPSLAGVPWLEPLLESGVARPDAEVQKLEFGYTNYLHAFDPYALSEGSGVLAKLNRLVVRLKRSFHVSLKYGELVADLPLIKNAIKGLEGVGKMGMAVWHGYHAASDSFPGLATFEFVSDSEGKVGEGGIADEYGAGVGAAVKQVQALAADSRKAEVTSEAPPSEDGWTLEPDTVYTMSVAWAGGSAQEIFRVSPSGPGAASFTLTMTPLKAEAEAGTLVLELLSVSNAPVRYVIPLTSANTARPLLLSDAISAVVPEGEARVEVRSGKVHLTAQDPYRVRLADEDANVALLDRLGLDDLSSEYMDKLVLEAPRLDATRETERLTLYVDGTRIPIDLDPGTTLLEKLAGIANLNLLAAVSRLDENSVTITTRSHSAASRVRAVFRTPSRWTATPSKDERGLDACNERLTAADIVALLGRLDGAKAEAAGGALSVAAETKGKGSTVTVSGNLADLVFGSAAKTQTIEGDPGVKDMAGYDDFPSTMRTLAAWGIQLEKLGAESRRLTRPLSEAIEDVLSAASAVESAAKNFAEMAGKEPPSPPETLGIFAPDGVTVGTPDRLLGTGGRGIVFISDGGSGRPDRAKFVLTEETVANIEAWSANFFKPADALTADPRRSLGFRVLSDSAVDLAGTSYAQLAALGRGTAKDERADGRKDVGVGVARVLGSYAAEVAGYEKVVISARNPGKDNDKAGATGGRVELLGQRVVIGGLRDGKASLANGVTLQLSDFALLGTSSFELAGLDGAEHLADGADSDKAWVKSPLAGAAWTETLRSQHPQTSHVDVHASTQVEQVVLPFRMRLTKESAQLGIVTPKEQDQRTDLRNQKEAAQRAKEDIEFEIAEWEAGLSSVGKKLSDYQRKADAHRLAAGGVVNPTREGYWNDTIQRLQTKRTILQAKVKRRKADLGRAEQAFQAASAALDGFSNTWDAKAFPMLEVTEETIRFGFVAGDGTWEDFAYMELTKDGIKMFQPKAKKVPTFDLESKAGGLSDGTKDTAVRASGGKLELKFKDSAKSGPLTWDAQGNVRIG
jgi:hypothetical protein